MQKTKLGISVGLLGAAVYFAGLFSGYIVMILLAGYVLLAEENIWLKKASVKAVALMMGFSLLSALLGLIPDAIGVVDSICNIFNGYFTLSVVTKIISMLRTVLSFAETVLFLILGLKALNQGTLPIPVIDKLINKYMD